MPTRAIRTLLAAALAMALAVFAASCSIGGSPGDEAIKLVPRDAYVYVHLNLDRGSDQYKKAAKLADRLPDFPVLVETILGRLSRSSDNRVDFEADIRPWLGGEAAFALVPSSRLIAGSLLALKVNDEAAATRLLDRIAGTAETSHYRDVTLHTYGADFVTAFVSGFLVIGQEAPVKRAIDASQGRVDSLDSNADASAARDPLPDDRLADAYASDEGVTRLLARQGSFLGQLGRVLSNPALRAAAAAVVAHDDRLEIVQRSSLDPKVSKRSQGIGALPPFEHTLTGEVAKNSLLYFGLQDPSKTFDRFERQVRVNAPGVAAGIDRVLGRIRRGGVDVRRRLLPLLHGEAAFWVQPGFPVPVAGLVVKGVDEKQAKDVMARLQGPLARSVSTRRSRQAPTFRQSDIDGVQAYSVRLSPAVNLTYAVFDGKLVIGTDPAAVRQVKTGDDSLEDADLYGPTLGSLPKQASSVLFLNLDRLLGLAERTGLGADPAYAEVRDDLRRLKALGATVRSSEDHLETRISVAIP